MSETSEAYFYGCCASCGKRVFIDLLDGEGRCDYCREIVAVGGPIPIRLVKRKNSRKEKKKSYPQ
jgi:DNA-directed RNA polymerase subunit RPC12/RpoP